VLEKYQILQGRAFSVNKTLVCAVLCHDRIEQISSHQVLVATLLQAAAISIMLIGRWSSNTCLRYIRKQVEHFSQHIAK
jgi:hypothetical protein